MCRARGPPGQVWEAMNYRLLVKMLFFVNA